MSFHELSEPAPIMLRPVADDRRVEGVRELMGVALAGLGAAAVLLGLTLAIFGIVRFTPAAAHAEVTRVTAPAHAPTPVEKAVAALASEATGLAPAEPFILKATGAERERAVHCLTAAVYYEAALEKPDGQRAVAQVVLNRVRDPNFPASICGVVYQGWERPTGCQFSFTCDGSLLRAPIPALWAQARKVAEAALGGSVMAEVGTATHYHAVNVNPWWEPTVVRIGQIGAHIFYRWPGNAGLPAAFVQRYKGDELALPEAVIDGRAPRPKLAAADASPAAAPAQPALQETPTTTPVPGFSGRPRQPSAAEIAWIDGLLDKAGASHGGKIAPASPPAKAATPAPVAGKVIAAKAS